MSKQRLFFIGIATFLLFVLFSFIVHKDLLTQFDFNTTVRLQDHISRRFDEFFSLLSFVGRFEIMAVFLVIVLLLRRKIKGIFVFIFFGIIHIFELFGKTFVDHVPPPHFLLRTHLPFEFPQFYVSTDNSYPSGHAARAFFISTVLFLFIYNSKKITKNTKYIILMLLLGYDIVMCISRVYLGEHWTSDVIGGSLLGFSLGLVSFVLSL